MSRQTIVAALSVIFVATATAVTISTMNIDPWSGPSFDIAGATIWVTAAVLMAAFVVAQTKNWIVAAAVSLFLLFAGVICPGLFWSPGPLVRAERSKSCERQLRQIGKAMKTYENAYGKLPPATFRDRHGKPSFSWIIAILPCASFGSCIDNEELTRILKSGEPWDGPSNEERLEPLYPLKCPGSLGCGWDQTYRSDDYSPNYVAVVGPGTMWRSNGSVKSSELPCGGAQTVALLEMHHPVEHWAKPFAPTVEEALARMKTKEGREFLRYHRGQMHVLFADGSVRTFLADMPDDVWQAILAGKLTPAELDALRPVHWLPLAGVLLWLSSVVWLFCLAFRNRGRRRRHAGLGEPTA
jgi:prepilin-type processing-associated H-X9-DG protein